MLIRLLPVFVTGFIIAIECSISFNSLLLPRVQENIGITEQLASYSISLGLFALGIAAMIYGSLCDGLGRRPIIILSSFLFSLGTALSVFAHSFTTLMIGRFCQGLGAGAGWVVGNASLRDVYSERAYVRMINYVHSVVGIVPAVAPMLGSYLLKYMDWRSILGLLLAFSLIILVLQIFFLPETLVERRKVTSKAFFQNFLVVLTNRRYQYFAIIKVLAVTLLFMDISTCSLMLVNHMGVQEVEYGYYVFPLFSMYVIAIILSEKVIVSKISIESILNLGFGFILVGNVITLILGLFYSLSPEAIQGLKMLTYIGFGLIFGNATGCLINSVSKNAGSAAALMIALEMLFSAVGITIIGYFFNGSAVPYSFSAVIVCLIVFVLTFSMKKFKYIQPKT